MMDLWDLARHRKVGKTWVRDSQQGYNGSYNPVVFHTFEGGQETWDFEHSWWFYQKQLKAGKIRPSDYGDPFKTIVSGYEDDGRRYIANKPKSYSYEGPIFAYVDHANSGSLNPAWYPGADFTPKGTLDAMGTIAISRCAPTNPHANAYSAVGEIVRDGLPSALGVNALLKRDVPGEYLNYEFGIKPFLSDVQKLISAYKDADRVMSQYIRDSGRLVRRSYRFPSSVETIQDSKVEGWSARSNCPNILYIQRFGTLSTVVTVQKETWFSGAFSYKACEPRGLAGVRDSIRKYNEVYGLSPTLKANWDLTPWSWLVDWFTNMGDVLNNLSMMLSDGLVLRYGYIMQHSVRTTTYTLDGIGLYPDQPVSPCYQKFTSDSKIRYKATPFGFGFNMSALTDRQIAILSALGMSRGGSVARTY